MGATSSASSSDSNVNNVSYESHDTLIDLDHPERYPAIEVWWERRSASLTAREQQGSIRNAASSQLPSPRQRGLDSVEGRDLPLQLDEPSPSTAVLIEGSVAPQLSTSPSPSTTPSFTRRGLTLRSGLNSNGLADSRGGESPTAALPQLIIERVLQPELWDSIMAHQLSTPSRPARMTTATDVVGNNLSNLIGPSTAAALEVLLESTPLLEAGFSLPLVMEQEENEKPRPQMLLIVSHRRPDSLRRVMKKSSSSSGGSGGGGLCSSAAAVDVAPALSSTTKRPKSMRSQAKSVTESYLSTSNSTTVVDIEGTSSRIPLTFWFLSQNNTAAETERCLVPKQFGEEDGESHWWYDLRRCKGCQQFLVSEQPNEPSNSKPITFPKSSPRLRCGTLADAVRDAVKGPIAGSTRKEKNEASTGIERGREGGPNTSVYKPKGKSFWRLKRFHNIRLASCRDCLSVGASDEGTPRRSDLDRDNWSSAGLSSLPSTCSSIELPQSSPLPQLAHVATMTATERMIREENSARLYPTSNVSGPRPASLFQATRKVSIVLLVEFDADFIQAARKVLTKNGALGIVHPTTEQAIKYLQDPNRIPIAGILCPFILKASGINATEFVETIQKTTSCRVSCASDMGQPTTETLKLIAFGGPHYSSCALKGGCINYFKYPPFSVADVETALSELGVTKR